jgi:Holliday junction DNA helicase RuvA
MIAFLEGTVSRLSPTLLILDVQGVGYEVHISFNTYSRIEGQQGKLRILTHLQIKEDAHTLFGFADEEERELFRHLISVNGVGPGIARIILSSMQAQDVRSAIIHEREIAFNKVKGVGPKTAKRIIIDLKDKLMKSLPAETEFALVDTGVSKLEEAASALMSLGFARNQVDKALQQVAKEGGDLSLEEWIKKGLKSLSS